MPSRNKIDLDLIQALEAFAKNNKMAGKGALSLALVLTRKAAKGKMPLDSRDFLTKQEGQVAGMGKSAVQSILRDHGISRILAEEAGRTSRGGLQRLAS